GGRSIWWALNPTGKTLPVRRAEPAGHRRRGRRGPATPLVVAAFSEPDLGGERDDRPGWLVDAARQQRLARDDQPLDLRGALVELHDLRVAHELLDGVVLDEAVAAVDLHGVGRDLHRGVRGEALVVRGLQRVALALVEQDG